MEGLNLYTWPRSGRHEEEVGGDRWGRAPPRESAPRSREASREPLPLGERPRIALAPRTKPLGVELDAPAPTARKARFLRQHPRL